MLEGSGAGESTRMHSRGQGVPGPSLTSAGQPDIRVSVNKEAEVEHIADVLVVEDQDALKQHHISRIYHRGLRQPEKSSGHRGTLGEQCLTRHSSWCSSVTRLGKGEEGRGFA